MTASRWRILYVKEKGQIMKIKRHTLWQLRILGSIFILGAFAYTAWPQAQTDQTVLAVTGDIPASLHLKTEDLDKMPQETAEVQEEDGVSYKYTGVLLRSLLESAGAPTGKTLRGKSLASYVLAKARDGYQVVFTPAEVDPTFGNERILVAYKRDGKSLFGYQGPFRILCPNDKAGARSLRMLESLEVVRLRK